MKRLLFVLAALLCFGAADAATALPVPSYHVDPSWPKLPLPHNWILGSVGGVWVDKQDHIWILHRPQELGPSEIGAALHPPRSVCCIPAPMVIEFDQAGNVLRAWGEYHKIDPRFTWPSRPHSLYIDDSGYVWLLGNGPNDCQILKFKRDGTFVKQFGTPGPPSPNGNDVTTRFGRPATVWVDTKANEVYVADGYANNRIIVLDATTGKFHRMWGAYGRPPVLPSHFCDPTLAQNEVEGCLTKFGYKVGQPPSGYFGNPVHCVVLPNDGLVYACDRPNDRIQVFSKSGKFVREMFIMPQTLGMGSPWGLIFWPRDTQKYVFMPDGENNQVRVYDRATWKSIVTFGTGGRYAGQFHWVHALGVDSKGNVYTGEVDTAQRVQKFIVTWPKP